ncbi:MAG TPA: transcriptional repressor [Arcobacter sp.]|nr:transcriptional repressor [Arcobacter sp.]
MDYIAILQNHNLKVTPQRLEIVDILHKNGHINIDDLYKALQSKFPSLSLATIYKNINKMCDKSFLIELKIPDQKNVYELTKKEHSHVVCSKCNAIMDINLDTLSILNQAKELSHYNLDKSSIIFNGLCPKCLD